MASGSSTHEASSGRSTREGNSGASESSSMEWSKKDTENRLIVATLVASVTFTAGITLPGGYNAYGDPNPGMPIMLHNPGFQVFIIFNAFATYSSILSVLCLLHTSGPNLSRAKRNLYQDMAGKILSMAIISMTVAFSASLILAVSKLKWLKIFCLCFGVYLAAAIYIFVQPFLRGRSGEDMQSSN